MEEVDRLHRKGRTLSDYHEIERLIRQQTQQRSYALNWRRARNYFALGKRAAADSEKKKYFNLCGETAERALSFNGASAEGYYFKALCMGKLGQLNGLWSSLSMLQSFRHDMEKAIKLDPAVEYGGAHRALGKFYHKLPFLLGGDLKKSIHHLKQAVRYGPKFADNYLFLAESYYADGDYPLARSVIHSFLKISRESQGNPELYEKIRQARKLLKKM